MTVDAVRVVPAREPDVAAKIGHTSAANFQHTLCANGLLVTLKAATEAPRRNADVNMVSELGAIQWSSARRKQSLSTADQRNRINDKN